MSDDWPTTQEFLLDHLRRIVEGVSCEEDNKTWIFGTGNDALISLYGFSREPNAEDAAINDNRKRKANTYLGFTSLGMEARDQMGVPERLAKLFDGIIPKEFTKALTEAGNQGAEEAYALEMLGKLRDVVDRAQKGVPEVHLLRKVPRQVDNYLSEAASCFRYGFDLACISLCRCALEEALKHRTSEQADLAKLIGRAASPHYKVLDPKLQRKAHLIRVSGNHCVHGILGEDQVSRTALRVLRHCREIIQDLYST